MAFGIAARFKLPFASMDVPQQQAPLEPPQIERPASAAPTEPQIHAREHDPYAALRYRDYWLYSLGWMISVVGQQVQSVAVQWQLFKRMGSPSSGALALGAVGAVQAIPAMLLALPAGHLADCFDRRKLIILSQMLAFACSGGLALASYRGASIGTFYLLLGLSATALAFGWPARSALLPQVVPPEVFTNAATWNSTTFQVAALAGPAIGGIVVNFTVTGAYVLDAFCAAAYAVLLLFLTIRPVAPMRRSPTLHSIAEGIRFVWRSQVILGAISLDLFAVLLGGATYLLPLYASDILHTGAFSFGLLRAAPALGAVTMAILQAHLPPFKRAGAAMLWAVAGFGVATIIFGLSHSLILSLVMLLLTGMFDNISVVVRHTLVQMLPPEQMRGRVSAVNNIFIGASNELGGLESGTSAWALGKLLGPIGGAIGSVVIGGVGSILTVIVAALIWPQLRRFGALADFRPMNDSQ